MRPSRWLVFVLLVLTLVLAGRTAGARSTPDLPASLTDQEFWRLSQDLSEPDGKFRSDNVLSNEMVFARLVPELLARTKPGGVYMGVGPEQNFTYIVHMKPRIAFITDIRRNNLHVLLMYKALFEISADRAEFISRLFSKPRLPGLSTTSTIAQLMDAYWTVETSGESVYAENLAAIQRHLTKTRAIPLDQNDLNGIALAYRAFYWYGPSMNYGASLSLTPTSAGNAATYRDLMTQADAKGDPLTFLGTEERFRFMKEMESKNLIIPLVGNFSGPKTIRAIGDYVRSRGATITAFYVSTVEPYLKRDGSFPTFCASVATLPMDDASVFIRPGNIANLGPAANLPGLSTPTIGTYQVGVLMPMRTGCV